MLSWGPAAPQWGAHGPRGQRLNGCLISFPLVDEDLSGKQRPANRPPTRTYSFQVCSSGRTALSPQVTSPAHPRPARQAPASGCSSHGSQWVDVGPREARPQPLSLSGSASLPAKPRRFRIQSPGVLLWGSVCLSPHLAQEAAGSGTLLPSGSLLRTRRPPPGAALGWGRQHRAQGELAVSVRRPCTAAGARATRRRNSEQRPAT